MTKDELKDKIHEAIRTRQMDYDSAVDDAVEEIMGLINEYETLSKTDYCNCRPNSGSLTLVTTTVCTQCNKEVKHIRF